MATWALPPSSVIATPPTGMVVITPLVRVSMTATERQSLRNLATVRRDRDTSHLPVYNNGGNHTIGIGPRIDN